MKGIEISNNGFLQLLSFVESAGKWLLPQPLSAAASDFIKAREEWLSAGWAELQFDGKLHPTREFARLLYNITNARAALRFRSEENTRYYLRGPVDLLEILSKESGWSLSLRPAVEALRFTAGLAEKQAAGQLAVQAVVLGEQKELETDLAAETSLPKALAEQMNLFYWED